VPGAATPGVSTFTLLNLRDPLDPLDPLAARPHRRWQPNPLAICRKIPLFLHNFCRFAVYNKDSVAAGVRKPRLREDRYKMQQIGRSQHEQAHHEE